ncbi:MAG: choice-of-anchor D domain-containing protein, partial [Myxococcota bacterium]
DNHQCEPAAIIKVDPESLGFGAASYGQEVKLPLKIQNTGKKRLDVTATEFESGTNPNPSRPDFWISSGAGPFSLNDGESHTTEVVFKQNGAGIVTGGLNIISTDLARPLVRISMQNSYKGVPFFQIVDRSVDPPAVLYAKEGDLYEYKVEMGLARHKAVTLRNSTAGNAILEIEKVESQNQTYGTFDFLVRNLNGDLLTLPVYLGPDEMADLMVDYTPSQTTFVKDETKLLKITTNDNDINHSGVPGNNSMTVALHALAAPSKIEVDPASVDMQEVRVGKDRSVVVRVTNTGKSDLLFDTARSGLEKIDGVFVINPPVLPVSLTPTGFVDVTVTYTPTEYLISDNALLLYTDDPDNPLVTVPLRGKGIPPLGAPCTKDEDCVSPEVCQQNRCCSTTCDGLCERCDVTDHLGTCWPLSDEVECAAAYCDSNRRYLHPVFNCSGSGTCPAKENVDCMPYGCDPATLDCRKSCADHAQCADGAACCSLTCRNISEYSNQCSGPSDLGSACANLKCYKIAGMCAGNAGTRPSRGSGEDVPIASGNKSMFFKSTAAHCPCALLDNCGPYGQRVLLEVPAGVTYSLCTYWTCGGSAVACKNVTSTTTDPDRLIDMQSNTGAFDYIIEVKWVSGSSCESWKLYRYWEKCCDV